MGLQKRCCRFNQVAKKTPNILALAFFTGGKTSYKVENKSIQFIQRKLRLTNFGSYFFISLVCVRLYRLCGYKKTVAVIFSHYLVSVPEVTQAEMGKYIFFCHSAWFCTFMHSAL